MSSFKRLLLATNLEPHSDRAMERAVQLAQQFDAGLTVLYAVGSGGIRRLRDTLPLHHIETEMRRHLDTIPGARDVAPMVVAVRGEVENAMVEYAMLWKADLMIAGRPQPPDMPFSVTSVERICVASSLPLLTVSSKCFGPYGNALVPVDFSPIARKVAATAAAMVPVGSMELLYVYDLPSSAGDIRLEADAFADDFAPLLAEIGVKHRLVSTRTMVGTPVESIVRAVSAPPATELVVMGTSGRSGVGRALVGSVAHEVLERLPCDVLIVKSDSPVPNQLGSS